MNLVDRAIRVATWNLWWRHGDWRARQRAIRETLRTVDADVLGLQEVCSREPDHSTWLRDEFGYDMVSAPDGDDDRSAVVNTIASRWPIVGAGWQFLDVGDMPPHRTVVWATIDAPVGRLRVYNTHLSHGFDQSGLRRRQLDQIAELIADGRTHDAPPYPPVLLGDLNATPDSDEIRRLTGRAEPAVAGLVFSDAWEQVGLGLGATYARSNEHVVDSAWPDRRLDYVLVAWPRPRPLGNPLRSGLFGVDSFGGVVASDHYGVYVDLAASAGRTDGRIE